MYFAQCAPSSDRWDKNKQILKANSSLFVSDQLISID